MFFDRKDPVAGAVDMVQTHSDMSCEGRKKTYTEDSKYFCAYNLNINMNSFVSLNKQVCFYKRTFQVGIVKFNL